MSEKEKEAQMISRELWSREHQLKHSEQGLASSKELLRCRHLRCRRRRRRRLIHFRIISGLNTSEEYFIPNL